MEEETTNATPYMTTSSSFRGSGSDKDRELGEAQVEIKALRFSERLREKAVEELTEELSKVDEKLKLTESLLDSKTLEVKKIIDEKKASMAAQFAAEATLRRVHAAQKDDDMPPIEAILAPLEAELKLARQEVTFSKASMVDDLQNKNQELMKQIEICQEENKIMDKMHRQKVAEVEKLTQTVRELEEAVLAGGAAANAVRDYQRKVQEMNEKFQLRLRVLEDTLRSPNPINRISGTPQMEKSYYLMSNGPSRAKSFSSILKHAKGTSKSFDGGTRSLDRSKLNSNGPNSPTFNLVQSREEILIKNPDDKSSELPLWLMLAKKVDTLTKAMEVEAKKMRREVAAMEKRLSAMRLDNDKIKGTERNGF
ncbi:microtubule-associated protein 70-2-like protein isoform X3 [Tanacetum coccineum]